LSVRGVVSVNAGAGACQDADIANAMPVPSVSTTASCVAPSGASASGQTIADLTTGSVGLALLASPLPDSSTNAAAQAQLSDRLVFSVPGGIGQNDDLLVDAPDIHAGDIDFLHTATVTIDAPPGVTFVSDSGVFLSAPEAAGSALGVASLLALGGIRRLRLHTAASHAHERVAAGARGYARET
jgi:hypothetical protein